MWLGWCYLFRADKMGCRQTRHTRICLLCVYHVIKRRVSGFDELCIRVHVCFFPCLLLCTSFSSLTQF